MAYLLWLILHTCRLRCDRSVPCGSCTKKGEIVSCEYAITDQTRRDGTRSFFKTSEAQIRLQKLEDMVTELLESSGKELNADNDRTSRTNGTADKQPKSLSTRASPHSYQSPVKGHLDYDGSEVNYLGATHWATILENVHSPVIG